MASGSFDFNMTLEEIIKSALRKIGVLSRDDDPSSYERDNARQALNVILKAWQKQGFGVWLIDEMTVYTAPGTESYNIGPTGDNATLTSGTSETTVATAAVETDTEIVAASVSGIEDGDYIGIELDDGTMQWTTIDGAPAGTTITLAAALTDDVAVGNYIYAYSTKVQRPIDILEVRLRNSSDQDIPINVYSREEYMKLPNKDNEGVINGVYFDNQIPDSIMYVWPTGSVVKERLRVSIKVPIDDMDSASDNLKFPVGWLRAIIFALAYEMTYEYRSKVKYTEGFLNRLEDDAGEMLDDAMTSDMDQGSMMMEPNMTETGNYGRR